MNPPRRPARSLPALGAALGRFVTAFALPHWVFRALSVSGPARFAAERDVPDLRPQHSYGELAYELAG